MKILLSDFENELIRLVKEATEIKVVIAFLTEGGLGWLPAEKAPCAEFIVGVDLGITSPGALKILQDRGANVRVFQETGRMFHPKAIYIKSGDGEFLIVGSNNLTSGGISSNHEISLLAERNKTTEEAFKDYLGYFSSISLRSRIPDEEFYRTYKQTDIQGQLLSKIRTQQIAKISRPERPTVLIADADISTFGELIRVLAREFPNLDRGAGGTITNHPLRRLNDEKFRPIFENVVSLASKGSLKASSQLTVGGKWYSIPNILATNEEKEPWENTYRRGRMVLQLHFSDDFSRAFLSLALQYNLPKSVPRDEVPLPVSQRFSKLHQHFENFSPDVSIDEPTFKHWTYKDKNLWVKPIVTISYNVDSLPEDTVLNGDLALLANALNGATAIS
jgi:HKD family nuclease